MRVRRSKRDTNWTGIERVMDKMRGVCVCTLDHIIKPPKADGFAINHFRLKRGIKEKRQGQVLRNNTPLWRRNIGNKIVLKRMKGKRCRERKNERNTTYLCDPESPSQPRQNASLCKRIAALLASGLPNQCGFGPQPGLVVEV